MTTAKRVGIRATLQSDILRLEGFKPANSPAVDLGLGPLRMAFPNATFPLGCVHEFLAGRLEDAAATKGFIAGLLSSLMGNSRTSLWVSSSKTVFPPGLCSFGIHPDRFIFVDVQKDNDVLWVIDEALRCGAIAAIVGELRDLSFTTSRRFQLAVEQSKVTGFLIRTCSGKVNTTACVSRWRITSLASDTIDDLPGIGFPKWRVELLRIRNGKAGVWDLQWAQGSFKQYRQPEHTEHNPFVSANQVSLQEKKVG